MLPGPEGQWVMPNNMREKLPGYAPDVAKSSEKARKVMQSLGYNPVEIGKSLFSIVRVLHDLDRLVRLLWDELERPRADRMLPHLRPRDVASDSSRQPAFLASGFSPV
jgi:hypothetical protein